MQAICDSLTEDKIEALARKWLAILPNPYAAADTAAGYRYDISIPQAEFSLTQVPGRPVSGRIFFDQVIADNLAIGRPDHVGLIFGFRGSYPAEGSGHHVEPEADDDEAERPRSCGCPAQRDLGGELLVAAEVLVRGRADLGQPRVRHRVAEPADRFQQVQLAPVGVTLTAILASRPPTAALNSAIRSSSASSADT